MSFKVVIMCGGNGTRLWPLSRKLLPKQLLKLVDSEYTMFQLSVLNVKSLNPAEYIIVCNELHTFMIEEQLHKLNIPNYTIISEPIGRDTSAAIASACVVCNDDDKLLVITADHIWNNKLFNETVNKGLQIMKDSIVVFGIKPTFPSTGFGYIKYNDNNLECFVEKPDLDKAKEYLQNNYLWNSGNFLFNVLKMKNEFKKHAKNIYDDVKQCIDNCVDNQQTKIFKIKKEDFQNIEELSIDYAIMEKQSSGKIVPYDGYWLDVGSFKALYDHQDKDESKNVINGDVLTEKTTNCLIMGENKLIATAGIDNLAVIDTRDSLLICNMDNNQDVKIFAKALQKDDRSEAYCHSKVYRPWGWYTNIEGNDNSGFKVKRIGVYPGKRLSLQSHNKRSEHWVVVKGNAKVRVGNDELILHSNQHVYIPEGVLHRMENIGDELVEFVETQIGEYLGEDDIVRYEDDFGRI